MSETIYKPDGDSAFGIDVSHWKPVKDWDALEKGNIQVGQNSYKTRFFGCKATEGNTFADSKLRFHRDNFRITGLLLGIYYHFARTGRPDFQAERFMEVVGPLRFNERLALDLEVLPCPEKDVLAWVDTFVATLLKEYPERRPIIYTSRRIWRMFGNPTWERARYTDLWVPRYRDPFGGVLPDMPEPWKERGYRFWQFTDEAPVPGIGKCDGNFFAGDVDALKRYADMAKNNSPAPVTT